MLPLDVPLLLRRRHDQGPEKGPADFQQMILAELIFCLAAIACFVVGALRWKTDWWVLGGLLLACAVAVMIFAGLLSLFK
ncbi:MAG TPA: hypothetical protein VHU41_14940 [Thermoanaerobaculia bacterium]|nr:hypothetical protein [Thermoanaerobaculia bacterium]